MIRMSGTTFLGCYLALSIILLANCSSSTSALTCGNFHNISCPFILKDDNPQNCFDPVELSCENNQTIFYISWKRFYVTDISYVEQSFLVRETRGGIIRLVDPGLQKDNCSSMPRYSLGLSDFEDSKNYYPKSVIYMNCSTAVVDSPRYVNASSTCIAETTTTTSATANNNTAAYYLYVVVDPHASDYKSSCNITWRTLISTDKDTFASFSDVHNEMVKGFYLEFYSDTGLSGHSCGNFHHIRCPFTLKDNPQNCSDPYWELSCENNQIIFYFSSKRFYVTNISYVKQSVFRSRHGIVRVRIRLVDPGLEKDNCSSMPRYSLGLSDFEDSKNYYYPYQSKDVIYMNCSAAVVDSPRYVNASTCMITETTTTTSVTANNTAAYYLYVVVGPHASDYKSSCNVTWRTLISTDKDTFASFSDVHNEMVKGFYLRFYSDEMLSGFENFLLNFLYYIYQHRGYLILGLIILAGRSVLGTLCLLAPLIYIIRRRHRAMDGKTEDFLYIYRHHMPTRYSYKNIKRMTKDFNEKLGQGGFGSVFKGYLLNNRPVAIKILNTTKGKGEDFINEVATIGKIHHVNVVQLIGFVAERSKLALIYEFMPNGSLDKFIFPGEGKLNHLSWDKIYEIALGIARGIEYLHQGCDMQILHFDIKPHNILLDENYIPKLSDFGLAKLYPMDESSVSVTAARGTIGYMAPELFYRSIGRVSYKSDVYSFGKLLMEMVGKRKNLNTSVENPSQIYYPSWIYDRLEQGGNIEIVENASVEEDETTMKMIIVALWCIQMKPIDRPSMTKVVEMLEGKLELLQMPPKPTFTPNPLVDGHENDTTSIDVLEEGTLELQEIQMKPLLPVGPANYTSSSSKISSSTS